MVIISQTVFGFPERDSLTVAALETADAARDNKSYSAAVSGLRLAGDLQGLTTSNPVGEATTAFLQFLAGNSGKPAAGDVQVLDS